MNLTPQILQVFDPAMCCSTGVCGPEVDTKLVQFAADLDWLKSQGVIIQRHNLSQNPAAFVENEAVKTALTEKGEAALPVMLLNGKVAVTGRYPDRAELAALLKLKATTIPASLFTPAVAELVAIGAAIAANCEPCLKYHYRQAQLLGVSKADMASAVRMAATVKDSPHQSILRLADKLTGASLSDPETTADSCCDDPAGAGKSGRDCCDTEDSPEAVAVVVKGKH